MDKNEDEPSKPGFNILKLNAYTQFCIYFLFGMFVYFALMGGISFKNTEIDNTKIPIDTTIIFDYKSVFELSDSIRKKDNGICLLGFKIGSDYEKTYHKVDSIFMIDDSDITRVHKVTPNHNIAFKYNFKLDSTLFNVNVNLDFKDSKLCAICIEPSDDWSIITNKLPNIKAASNLYSRKYKEVKVKDVIDKYDSVFINDNALIFIDKNRFSILYVDSNVMYNNKVKALESNSLSQI